MGEKKNQKYEWDLCKPEQSIATLMKMAHDVTQNYTQK